VALPAMSRVPVTLSLLLSRPLGFAHLCRGFPARSIRSIPDDRKDGNSKNGSAA